MPSKKQTKKMFTDLPKHVEPSDLEWPKSGTALMLHDGSSSIRFYKVQRLGWVMLTLEISSGRHRYKPSSTARSYAIGVDDGKVYRVGHGPHVEKEVTVHVSKANHDRLKPLLDLLQKGLADAGLIRDRISSRRAQGQVNRANGMTYWHW